MGRTFTQRKLETHMELDEAIVRNFKLREADSRELCTLFGCHPNEALETQITIADDVNVAFCDGVPFCIYGVERTFAEAGLIWGVGTDLISEGGFDIIKWGRDTIDKYFNRYSVLYNYMDRRNAVHRRYIEFCGFRFTENSRVVNNFPFDFFIKTRRN